MCHHEVNCAQILQLHRNVRDRKKEYKMKVKLCIKNRVHDWIEMEMTVQNKNRIQTEWKVRNYQKKTHCIAIVLYFIYSVHHHNVHRNADAVFLLKNHLLSICCWIAERDKDTDKISSMERIFIISSWPFTHHHH